MTTKNASLNGRKSAKVLRQNAAYKWALNPVAALAFIIMIGANLIFWQSELGHAVWVLFRVTFRLIPPTVGVAGTIIVLLWLYVLRRVW